MRVDVLNKVLAELVGRTAPAESETAGLLGLALVHPQAIAEVGPSEVGREEVGVAEVGGYEIPSFEGGISCTKLTRIGG